MNRNSFFTIISLFALIFALSACQNDAASRLDAECRRLFPADEPGASVLIMQGDKVLFDCGYGIRLIDSLMPNVALQNEDLRCDGEAMYNIASCSKQFTAVAIMQLVAEGKIQMDEPIRNIFPELADTIWSDIRLTHLLSHSSGIPDLRGYLSRRERVYGNDSLATAYLFSLDTLHFVPGTAYEYVNPTYTLLGEAIERLSGQPFEEYMQQNIFEPAGMKETFYFYPQLDYSMPHITHGYEYGELSGSEEHSADRGDAQKCWYEYDYGEETFFATRPDGGIYSSTHNIAKWEQYLRKVSSNDSLYEGLSTLLLDAMSPHTIVTGSPYSDYQNREDTYYGYGWFVEPKKGCIYHTGDNGGYKALICRYPTQDLFVVVLSNRTDWDRYALKTMIEALYCRK